MGNLLSKTEKNVNLTLTVPEQWYYEVRVNIFKISKIPKRHFDSV